MVTDEKEDAMMVVMKCEREREREKKKEDDDVGYNRNYYTDLLSLSKELDRLVR
jgi:hypothetical protein